MKTRTLLLLSVGTALMILLAGGALLFQLAGQDSSAAATPLGVVATVGDVDATVVETELVGTTLAVAMEVGGVDDPDGVDSFRLVTGDQRLSPLAADGAAGCVGITEASQRCTLEFDVGAAEGTSRVLVLRRGDEQATWRLA